MCCVQNIECPEYAAVASVPINLIAHGGPRYYTLSGEDVKSVEMMNEQAVPQLLVSIWSILLASGDWILIGLLDD